MDAAPDRNRWQLEITGAVRSPVALSTADLRTCRRQTVVFDPQGVSRNPRPGTLWEGVAPRTLLRLAGALPAVGQVRIRSEEYGRSTRIPLAALMSPEALLADTHDGEPLPAEQGGPLRLLVPGPDGMETVKWVTGIDLLPGTGRRRRA
jgi:DMSO/TMAO reductase YedYZ molybdopterin-dependent catalytic subunit